MINAGFKIFVTLLAIAAYVVVALALLFLTSLADGFPTAPCYPACSSHDTLFDVMFWSLSVVLIAQILSGVAWIWGRNRPALLVLAGVPIYVIAAALLVPTIDIRAFLATTPWQPKTSTLAWSALVILLGLTAAGVIWAAVGGVIRPEAGARRPPADPFAP